MFVCLLSLLSSHIVRYPEGYFVLSTVSALMEPKSHGQALCKALCEGMGWVSNSSCPRGAHSLVWKMNLQITIIVLEQREMRCVVPMQERDSWIMMGRGLWEDITEQVTS